MYILATVDILWLLLCLSRLPSRYTFDPSIDTKLLSGSRRLPIPRSRSSYRRVLAFPDTVPCLCTSNRASWGVSCVLLSAPIYSIFNIQKVVKNILSVFLSSLYKFIQGAHTVYCSEYFMVNKVSTNTFPRQAPLSHSSCRRHFVSPQRHKTTAYTDF